MQQHGRIREAISKIIPGYDAISEIDRTKKEFHIAGRTFHTPVFATDSGKAKFHLLSLPRLADNLNGSLRLMTVRSEGQFNTVVYEEEDLYRGQTRRDVILLHEDDIERLGLAVDQAVTVRSATGSLSNVKVRPFDIRPGNAVMYYPEANVLIGRTVDPTAKTPSFKNVTVTIERAS
jgi:anaerobic selenocysteine-containing dehydrogenase